MATHFNYSLQNFSMNNAKVLTGNSQPVPDFKLLNPYLEYGSRTHMVVDRRDYSVIISFVKRI